MMDGGGNQVDPSNPMTDLKAMSLNRLLALHAAIMNELRDRGVARSANNPTGDLAEFLFCRTFLW